MKVGLLDIDPPTFHRRLHQNSRDRVTSAKVATPASKHFDLAMKGIPGVKASSFSISPALFASNKSQRLALVEEAGTRLRHHQRGKAHPGGSCYSNKTDIPVCGERWVDRRAAYAKKPSATMHAITKTSRVLTSTLVPSRAKADGLHPGQEQTISRLPQVPSHPNETCSAMARKPSFGTETDGGSRNWRRSPTHLQFAAFA